MSYEPGLNMKIRYAFTLTARKAEEAGFVDWSDRIRVAQELWDEAGGPDLKDDYTAALLALDTTIASQAGGPQAGLVRQWRYLLRRLGRRPELLPRSSFTGHQYLQRVSSLRFARSLSLLMLDRRNEDREDPDTERELDEAAAVLLLSDEAASNCVPAKADDLLEVADAALEVLQPLGQRVQNTRNRVEYTRDVVQNITEPDTNTNTPELPWSDVITDARDAVGRAAKIMQEVGDIFTNR